MAATGTSRTTRSSDSSGTPRSHRSTKARPRSNGWSLPGRSWRARDRGRQGTGANPVTEERGQDHGATERKRAFETMSGLPVERVYTPADLPGWRDAERLGRPGEYPFTRGVYPTMYRGRLWTMRMFAGFGRPEDTNRRFKFLLDQGQTGLSTAFDMPALMGYDAD